MLTRHKVLGIAIVGQVALVLLDDGTYLLRLLVMKCPAGS